MTSPVEYRAKTPEADKLSVSLRFIYILLDLLRNECSHIAHIRCTNTLTSYILKTHREDEINLAASRFLATAQTL